MNLLDKLGLGGTRTERRIDPTTLAITRTSLQTGVVRTLEFKITEDEWEAYRKGAYIQVALAHLTEPEREFIMSGITAQEWAEMTTEDND